ncbi:MAG: hypothetical protein JNK12_12205 [Acidimicrobiales bacterium]|nr:hypothetical protein [Acidimicrobiales bacterium]
MSIEPAAEPGWWLAPSGWLLTVLPAMVLALLSLVVFGDVRMALVSLTIGSAAMLLARALIVTGKRLVSRFSAHRPPVRGP